MNKLLTRPSEASQARGGDVPLKPTEELTAFSCESLKTETETEKQSESLTSPSSLSKIFSDGENDHQNRENSNGKRSETADQLPRIEDLTASTKCVHCGSGPFSAKQSESLTSLSCRSYLSQSPSPESSPSTPLLYCASVSSPQSCGALSACSSNRGITSATLVNSRGTRIQANLEMDFGSLSIREMDTVSSVPINRRSSQRSSSKQKRVKECDEEELGRDSRMTRLACVAFGGIVVAEPQKASGLSHNTGMAGTAGVLEVVDLTLDFDGEDAVERSEAQGNGAVSENSTSIPLIDLTSINDEAK